MRRIIEEEELGSQQQQARVVPPLLNGSLLVFPSLLGAPMHGGAT
jgi:hypothetical protein